LRCGRLPIHTDFGVLIEALAKLQFSIVWAHDPRQPLKRWRFAARQHDNASDCDLVVVDLKEIPGSRCRALVASQPDAGRAGAESRAAPEEEIYGQTDASADVPR